MVRELTIKNNKSTDKEYKFKKKDAKVKEQTPEEQKEEQLKVQTLSSLFKTKKESFDKQVNRLIEKSAKLEDRKEFDSLIESIGRAKNADYAVKLFKEAREIIRKNTVSLDTLNESNDTVNESVEYKAYKDGKELKRGDELISFRGNKAYFYGVFHPRKVAVTFEPVVKEDEYIDTMEYYPSVYDIEIKSIELESVSKEIKENFEEERIGETTVAYNIFVQNKDETTGTDFSVFDKNEYISAIDGAVDEIKKIAKKYEDKGFDIELTIKGVK